MAKKRTPEQEWLDDDDMEGMIETLRERGQADPRKLRLVACAWAWRMGDALAHKAHRRLIELAEDHADGLIPFAELSEARELAVDVLRERRVQLRLRARREVVGLRRRTGDRGRQPDAQYQPDQGQACSRHADRPFLVQLVPGRAVG